MSLLKCSTTTEREVQFMGEIYGYARVSTKTQRLDRQIANITEAFPDMDVENIFKEKYTGTTIENRKEFNKLIKIVKSGDTIVFDSVSRMSRNSDDGIETYFKLYEKGVNLIFLKEPHINTSVYKESLNHTINATISTGDKATDDFINGIIERLNLFQQDLAKKQILLAFNQAEKEVKDTRKRVSEGMKATQRKNKQLPEEQQTQIGQKKGAKLNTKKSIEAKKIILKNSKDFNGTNTDTEVMKIASISRNSYYKYKRELFMEQGQA